MSRNSTTSFLSTFYGQRTLFLFFHFPAREKQKWMQNFIISENLWPRKKNRSPSELLRILIRSSLHCTVATHHKYKAEENEKANNFAVWWLL